MFKYNNELTLGHSDEPTFKLVCCFCVLISQTAVMVLTVLLTLSTFFVKFLAKAGSCIENALKHVCATRPIHQTADNCEHSVALTGYREADINLSN